LREHAPGEITFGQGQGDEKGGESELRDECQGFEVVAGYSARGEGGGEIQEGVIRGEVVSMVDAREVV
jgi:hypothetical protein